MLGEFTFDSLMVETAVIEMGKCKYAAKVSGATYSGVVKAFGQRLATAVVVVWEANRFHQYVADTTDGASGGRPNAQKDMAQVFAPRQNHAASKKGQNLDQSASLASNIKLQDQQQIPVQVRLSAHGEDPGYSDDGSIQ